MHIAGTLLWTEISGNMTYWALFGLINAFAICFGKPIKLDAVGQFESFHATPWNGEEIDRLFKIFIYCKSF